jgi:hypothetical protein
MCSNLILVVVETQCNYREQFEIYDLMCYYADVTILYCYPVKYNLYRILIFKECILLCVSTIY